MAKMGKNGIVRVYVIGEAYMRKGQKKKHRKITVSPPNNA